MVKEDRYSCFINKDKWTCRTTEWIKSKAFHPFRDYTKDNTSRTSKMLNNLKKKSRLRLNPMLKSQIVKQIRKKRRNKNLNQIKSRKIVPHLVMKNLLPIHSLQKMWRKSRNLSLTKTRKSQTWKNKLKTTRINWFTNSQKTITQLRDTKRRLTKLENMQSLNLQKILWMSEITLNVHWSLPRRSK